MNIIIKHFPELSDLQIQQFKTLQHFYRVWNLKINLISRKDIESLYLKHVLHSLAIAKYINFSPKASVLDVGTGGGSQAFHLQFYFPTHSFIW